MLITCIRPAVPLNLTNVVETRTNQPYFNGLYNLFMVKLGMVYFCLTHIIPSMTITNERIYMDLYGFLLFFLHLKSHNNNKPDKKPDKSIYVSGKTSIAVYI